MKILFILLLKLLAVLAVDPPIVESNVKFVQQSLERTPTSKWKPIFRFIKSFIEIIENGTAHKMNSNSLGLSDSLAIGRTV